MWTVSWRSARAIQTLSHDTAIKQPRKLLDVQGRFIYFSSVATSKEIVHVCNNESSNIEGAV